MNKKWTVEEARNYVAKVQKGKQQVGLKYCSAVDFLMNHTNTKIENHPLAQKEGDDDILDSDS